MFRKNKLLHKSRAGLATNQVVLILGSLAIVSGTVIGGILLLRGSNEAPQPSTRPALTAENVEEIQKDVQDKIAQGMFETHMNTTWTFPDGSSPSSDAVMGNAESNNYDFYFTITLNDTGEQVFESNLIAVGSQIAEIKLDQDLPAGTYPATVAVNMIDEEGEPIAGNMGISVTLVVES